MITRILVHLLLFLLPLALYILYRRLVAKDKDKEVPYTVLYSTGLVLTSLGLVIYAVFDGYEAGSVYEPAQLIDGEIVPGRMITPEDQGATTGQ